MPERSEQDYYTVEEVTAALTALPSVELIRLERMANSWVLGLPHYQGQDLLQTAFERLVSGSRRWPRGVGFMPFMNQVVRSIFNQYWEAREGAVVVSLASELAADSDHDTVVFEELAVDLTNRPDEEVSASQLLEEIDVLFREDEQAREVLLWQAEGYGKKEIQRDLDLSDTEYDTVTKRIRRRVSQVKRGCKGDG